MSKTSKNTMSDILNKATTHFDNKGTKEIKVPEWNTTIYTTPFTLGNKRTLDLLAKGDQAEFLARLLILKAKDKDGKNLFDIADKPTLMGHVDATVIDRIVADIVDTMTPEKAEEK